MLPTLLLPALVALVLLATPARGDTIVVTGAPGGSGAPGAPGGGPGGDGGPGADAAAATAAPADALASARADGGTGGAGGAGGAGTLSQAGGTGGAGGAGGSATATAASSPALGASTTELRAFGGWGGAGGAGGTGGGAGAGASGPGGSGGSAAGNACAVSPNASATTTFSVVGGRGGAGATGGAGGSAIADVCAESEGAGSAAVGQLFQGGVSGGRGGDSVSGPAGAGGDATGSAEASAESGGASALLGVRGGFGGDALPRGAGGDGGAADASAAASGGSSAMATSEATGGDGGIGRGTGNTAGDGGAATAQAAAHASDGTATARATAQGGAGGNAGFNAPSANGGRGADVSLGNAVSGASPTTLVLEQVAIAGSGGSAFLDGNGGDGGDAVSLGDFSNGGGGSVVATLTASAGGGGSGATHGEGGAARVGGSVTAATDRDAALFATVNGGGSNTGTTGLAIVDPLFAATAGSGAATVDLTVRQGTTRFGDGADVSLVNHIDAVTGASGRITLRQELWGGGSSSLGHGGSAEGVLALERSAALIELETSARGGASSTGRGGAALVDLRAVNDAGAVTLEGQGWGGMGGGGQHEGSGDGGDATGHFEAETRGDGHDIRIGWDEVIELNGGGGGLSFAAGDASFVGRGVAAGDSAVTVRGLSRGTNASADAFGSNAGDDEVSVFAGASGDQSATARARGESDQGDVTVQVSQEVFAGGDSILEDAATGATAGDLELVQLASAGRHLTGNAGDARSAIDVSHLGGGALELWLEAQGGRTSTGQAGDAEVEAFGEAQGDVTIRGTAREGEVGPNGSAGEARIAGLFGRSLGGGAVTVRGFASGAAPGPGSEVVLDNAVDGETSGALVLEQTAFGYGAASSRLANTASSSSLRADVFASAPFASQAELDVTNTSGSVVANGRAAGGAEATVSARATSAGDGHAVTVCDSSLRCGAAGRDATASLAAGNATSESFGTALGDSLVSVSDYAIGGSAFGLALPQAGHARSHAEGASQGDSKVDVAAFALGGEGVLGGAAEATAHGSSERGWVTVAADQVAGRSIGGDGVDLDVRDAVTGSTAGRLSLRQSAHAGAAEAGTGNPGSVEGGDARSELHAENPGGGDLDATVEAFGGRGAGGQGGDAAVVGTAEGASDVRLTGHAVAGNGATSGVAQIEPLFARSTGGGEVEVGAHIESGGAAALLDNAVRGETSGVLRLAQYVQSYAGAASRLDQVAGTEYFSLRSTAEGQQASGDAALADATALARNELGGADASATAKAGSSTGSNGASARGGEARAVAEATALLVSEDTLELEHSARAWSEAKGGDAGTASGGAALDSVAGGAATSEGTALAELGRADSSARATGGRGGMLDLAAGPDQAGRGGAALAVATATGSGNPTSAAASAEGGASGQLAGQLSGSGGDARAFATAIGEREVFVSAGAVGGAGAAGGEGSALARAHATGKTGEVEARAGLSQFAGFPAPVLARTAAAVKGDVRLGASMAAGALLDDAEAHGFLNSARHVSDAALAEALAGNGSVAAGLDGASVLALLETGANASTRSLTFTSELSMSAGFLAPSLGDELLIGFLDPELGGIRKLEVAVLLGNQIVFEGRAKRGRPLLDDQLVTLQLAPDQALRIAFEIKAGKSSDTGALDLVVATRSSGAALAAPAGAVPEPGALTLLACGGLALAATRSRPLRRGAASPRG